MSLRRRLPLSNSSQLQLLYANLVFNGFIFGPTYEYTYNSQLGPAPKSGFYFDGLVDLAGNIVGIAESANYKNAPAQTILRQCYLCPVKEEI